MLDLTYVLVPSSVSMEVIMQTNQCYGTLTIPGRDDVRLYILEGDGADAPWFVPTNVVFAVKSRTFSSNSSKFLDAIAVSAALDASKMRNDRPPAFANVRVFESGDS